MSIKLIEGDCLTIMRKMIDNGVTAIVTDPPYGLKFMGKDWDYGIPGVPFWVEMLRICKPGAVLLSFGGTRTYHRLTCAIEDAGWLIRDCLMWLYGTGFPKSLNVQQAMNKAARGYPQGVADPESPSHGKFKGGCSSVNPVGRGFGAGAGAFMKEQGVGRGDDEGPWHGWGTALKPAWEPIVLAMKSTEGTFAKNALKWGVAGLNVDDCRVELVEDQSPSTVRRKSGYKPNPEKARDSEALGKLRDRTDPMKKSAIHPSDNLGRWPANLILDEEAGEMLDEQSGLLKAGVAIEPKPKKMNRSIYGKTNTLGRRIGFSDDGGASRFFYCAKASKKERGEGNTHPTCKPIKLMEYLVKLVTMPTGTIILDPFVGSGTTGVACKNLGVSFLGIEIEEESFQTAQKRLGL